MTKIKIRPATPADADALLDSSSALFAEDAGTRDPTFNTEWPRQAGPQRFVDAVTNPARLQLVAVDEATVVGHLIGSLSEPTPVRPITIATLTAMYVRPAYRSGGVGGELIHAFRAWAHEQNADRMTVTAFADNTQAIRFYQRMGFTPHSLALDAIP